MLSYQTCQARRLETRRAVLPGVSHERPYSTCLERDSHSGDTNRAASCLSMVGGSPDRDPWHIFEILMA